MKLVIYFPALLLAASVTNVKGDCNLSLQDDFEKQKNPVFIQNGSFLAPDKTGAISLRRSQTLLVGCPGARNYVKLGDIAINREVMKVQCLGNNTFQDFPADLWEGPFKTIRCNTQPQFSSKEVKGGCGKGRKLYRVGYTTDDSGSSIFYSLYEACFDSDLVRTVYVRHEISPSSIYFFKEGNRPKFTEGGLFGKVSMTKLYSLNNQKKRINDLLGPGAAEKYINKKEFLSRGHLAARADFSLRVEQVTTFHYVNAAPQWQRGNAGDWAALEESLRKRIHSLGRSVTVYTGTHGVLSFDHRKELYLATDGNNNGIVPVPLYFYKLVYDPRAKKAVVFVSINSSFYNRTMTDQLTICEDVCEQKEFSWLSWRDDGTTSFCCSYADAEELNLPKLSVNGLFY